MRTKAHAVTTLAVVVVARNEQPRIGRCLESVFSAIEPYPNTPVVVVDSDSTDDTTRIAQRYPAMVCRYRGVVRSAAAGRRIGFEQVDAQYVLFLDGDCIFRPDWLPEALRLLTARPDIAVVFGGREEVVEGPVDRHAPAAPQEYGLGGNALYRADVLRTVGSFNPFILGNEEAELLGRIRAAGYDAAATPAIMVRHNTTPKDTIGESVRRWRLGYARGVGQVLRVGLSQGLFGYYLREYQKVLFVLGFLVAGGIAGIIALLMGTPAPAVAWLALGIAAFCLLAVRRASLKEAASIVANWLAVAVELLPSFLRRPQPANSFKPEVEILSVGRSFQRASTGVGALSPHRHVQTRADGVSTRIH